MTRIQVLKQKALRDIWNLVVSNVPSRRIRFFVLARMLGKFGNRNFVGLNVKFFDPHNVFLEDGVVINSDCIIDARGGTIIIGNDSDIGCHSHLWTLEHNPHDNNHGTRGESIFIGDHVWLATRVTILPGIRIDRGAVVGAGSIVTKSIDEKSVMAGVPAKKIGVRDNSLDYTLNFNPRFR